MLTRVNDSLSAAVLDALDAAGFGDIRRAHEPVFEHVAGEGSRLTDLAAAARLTKQAVQYLVDDLERLGYVERTPDPVDRRAKLVRLTARGRMAVLAARDAIADAEADWERTLGERRLHALRRTLETLVAR